MCVHTRTFIFIYVQIHAFSQSLCLLKLLLGQSRGMCSSLTSLNGRLSATGPLLTWGVRGGILVYAALESVHRLGLKTVILVWLQKAEHLIVRNRCWRSIVAFQGSSAARPGEQLYSDLLKCRDT